MIKHDSTNYKIRKINLYLQLKFYFTKKQTLKNLLKEEFGWFKKDTVPGNKNQDKTNQKFQIKMDEKEKTLNPKKNEDDDEDF